MSINSINSSGGNPENSKEIKQTVKEEVIDSIFNESKSPSEVNKNIAELIFDDLTENSSYEDFTLRKLELREKMNALMKEKLEHDSPNVVEHEEINPVVLEPEDPRSHGGKSGKF